MKKLALFLPIWLAACSGGSSITPTPEYGEGVVELRFAHVFFSTSNSRDETMVKEATKLCHGPFEKVGEKYDREATPVWYIKCVETVQ